MVDLKERTYDERHHDAEVACAAIEGRYERGEIDYNDYARMCKSVRASHKNANLEREMHKWKTDRGRK